MMRITADSMRELLKVYFIMGTTNCDNIPQATLKDAIEGGITLFQFREKGNGAMTGQEKYHIAKSLQKICQHYRVPFIMNDDIELAISLNADGVHIGQEDQPVDVVRKKIGEDKILGVSAHTIEEVQEAIRHGADYLGIGPTYSTTTKQDTRNIRGLDLIQSLRRQGFTIPIVGIGGINTDNAKKVIQNGADGVSVISAISKAHFPLVVARSLRIAVESVTSNRK